MKYIFNNVSKSRSKTMRAIKGKNTSIEIILRKELYRRGLRYRVNYTKLVGKPDIVFIGKKLAIFCDSEFWHGKNWEKKKERIKSNREYWIPKIERNISRDKTVNEQLKNSGWTVLRFWESDIKKNTNEVVNIILGKLNAIS